MTAAPALGYQVNFAGLAHPDDHVNDGIAMPTPGYSLLGFMDETTAILHQRKICVTPQAATDEELSLNWTQARDKRGAPLRNCGLPEVRDIPHSHRRYVESLLQLPWVQSAFQAYGNQPEIRFVEIAPLITAQLTVDIDRCNDHCSRLAAPPSMDEIFEVCLPAANPSEQYNCVTQNNSLLIKSRSLNLRVHGKGIINNQVAGVLFGPSLPLVHVARLDGRCYLQNGLHRAVGLGLAGVSHLPCVVRDVQDALSAGVLSDGTTFPESLLKSADPPPVGHIIDGRATDVQLRKVSRVLHVSWADYVWPEE